MGGTTNSIQLLHLAVQGTHTQLRLVIILCSIMVEMFKVLIGQQTLRGWCPHQVFQCLLIQIECTLVLIHIYSLSVSFVRNHCQSGVIPIHLQRQFWSGLHYCVVTNKGKRTIVHCTLQPEYTTYQYYIHIIGHPYCSHDLFCVLAVNVINASNSYYHVSVRMCRRRHMVVGL